MSNFRKPMGRSTTPTPKCRRSEQQRLAAAVARQAGPAPMKASQIRRLPYDHPVRVAYTNAPLVGKVPVPVWNPKTEKVDIVFRRE